MIEQQNVLRVGRFFITSSPAGGGDFNSLFFWPPPRGTLDYIVRGPKLHATGGNQLMIPLVKAHVNSI